MTKLIETLKSFGIEIPADKQADVKKALSEHYKNTAEYNKAISKLEADRDAWKEKAESAEETLKGFEGIDPAQVQTELATWKKKAEDAEKDRDAKILQRDQRDYLKGEFDKLEIKSERVRDSLMREIMDEKEGLKWKDGAFQGLADYLSKENEKDHFYQTQAEKDEAAAREQAAGGAPKFTSQSEGKPAGGDNKPTFNFGFTPIRDVKKTE